MSKRLGARSRGASFCSELGIKTNEAALVDGTFHFQCRTLASGVECESRRISQPQPDKPAALGHRSIVASLPVPERLWHLYADWMQRVSLGR